MLKLRSAVIALVMTAAAALGAAPAAQAAVSVPTVPTKVKAAPGNLTATILWTPPASAGGSAITSYRVSANGVTKVLGPTARRWTFTKLRGGVTYKLSVQARNAKGASINATVAVKVYPAIKRYTDCKAMNAVYLHGVGRSSSAVDRSKGVEVRTFYVSRALYDLNTGRDRDKDKIACEKL